MNLFPKRIIILGSSGFIGKQLLEKFSLHHNLKIKGFSSNECNLLSMDDVRNNLSDITRDDALIMTSAITRSKKNTYHSMLKNIEMAENVSRILSEYPAGQVIYMSTIDVYGINLKENDKIKEESDINPNDYYALSKIAGEFLLKKKCSKKNIPLTILRLTGVYGPGDKKKSTIGNFISSAFNDERVYVYGRGEDLRDYVYINDVYKIARAAIEKKLNKTLNIVTGKSYSILEIVEIIKSFSPSKLHIEFRERSSKDEKRIENMVFDNSLLRKKIPGLQIVGLKKGISLYISHCLSEVINV